MKIEIKLSRIPLLVPCDPTPMDGFGYSDREQRMEVKPKGIGVLVLDVGDTDRDHHNLMDQADGFLRKALGRAVPNWEARIIELTAGKDEAETQLQNERDRADALDRELEIAERKRERLRRHVQVVRQQLCQFDFGTKTDNEMMRRLVKLDPEAD